MSLTPEQTAALDVRLRHELWRRGDLSWKLDSNQYGIHQQIQNCSARQFVLEAGRKVGKSYLYSTIGLEACIRNPGKRVNYATPTGKMATEIVVPIVRMIAEDAPPELVPTYSSQSGHITFPENGPAKGAYIVLFGCEDQVKADRGRGPEAVLNIVDEGGFVPPLQYTLSSVLNPQTIRTGGKTLICSSPPLSPGHEFCVVADAAADRGAYAHRDIYSNAMMTLEQIEAYIADEAASRGLTVEQFKQTSDFKREFLALRTVDKRLAVIPEFTDVERDVVREYTRPAGFQYVDKYVSLDPGMKDLSGGLFAYFDFLKATIVIEDEFLLPQAITRTLADEVRKKEAELWGSNTKVRLRVVDDPHKRLVADLWNEHAMSFSPAQKDNREAAINLLRNRLVARKLVILPRCKNLVRQLRNAIYNRAGNDMVRTVEDGHFDLVAACWYLVRSINLQRNPYPDGWDIPAGYVRTQSPPPKTSSFAKALLSGTPLGRRLMKTKRH